MVGDEPCEAIDTTGVARYAEAFLRASISEGTDGGSFAVVPHHVRAASYMGVWTRAPPGWSSPSGAGRRCACGRARRLSHHRRRARPARLRRPAEARAFLALRGRAARPADLGDMAAACDLIEAAIAGGRGSWCTATTTSTASAPRPLAMAVIAALGGTSAVPCRAGSTRATASRSRPSSASRPSRLRLLLTVDCGITAVRGRPRARELGLDVIVTDHHRPGASCPTARWSSRAAAATIRSPSCAAPAWPEARRGAVRPPAGPTAARSSAQLDLVALATVADVVPLWTRTARLVRAGLQAPGAHRPAGPAGADARPPASTARASLHGPRLPAGAAHQRRRAARAPGRGARAAPDRATRRGPANWPTSSRR